MGKFTIDDLRMKETSYRSVTGNETLSFHVWNGTCWLTIAGAKDRKRIFSKALRYDEFGLIGQYMQELNKMDPGSEKSLVYNGYNRQERKRIVEFILVLKKDEQKIRHVIIKANGSTFDFPIMFNSTWTSGTGDIPEAERSEKAFKQLITHLINVVPFQIAMSSVPNDQQRSGGGSSGGGYSGQGDFKSSNRNLPSDDDIFQD